MSERPNFAGIVRSHEYALALRTGAICTCGFIPTVEPGSLRHQQDHHGEHLVSALNAEVDRWLGDERTQRLVAAALHEAVMPNQPHPPDDPRSEHPCRKHAAAALAALRTPDPTDDDRMTTASEGAADV